ncbi:MAG: hypothetical protein KAJ44_00795 [Thermoplasmatales archaeon]|nr:hypothetical protein [Thermoplasmatales archaeon]
MAKENVKFKDIPNADDLKYNVVVQEPQDLFTIAKRVEKLRDFTEDIKIHMQNIKSKYKNNNHNSQSSGDLSVDLKHGILKAKWVDKELFLIFDQLYNLHRAITSDSED